MKTRTILKKLAVLIIFIFLTNVQAQPNPCGCPVVRGNLDDLNKSFLTYGNLIKGDLDNPASSNHLGAAGCSNCTALSLMVIDYLNKGEAAGDKNPFLNKKLYDDYAPFMSRYSKDIRLNHGSTIFRDYLKPKYPDRTITTKDFTIPSSAYFQGLRLTQSGLIKFAEFRNELTTILDNTEVGDSGIIGIQKIEYNTSSLKVKYTNGHAVAFFTFLEDGKKITRIFDLQNTSGNYMVLDAKAYLDDEFNDATMPKTQKIFIPRAILILKK